jgi:hypothetical protein
MSFLIIIWLIRSGRVEMLGACGICGGVERRIQRILGANLKEKGYTKALFYVLSERKSKVENTK